MSACRRQMLASCAFVKAKHCTPPNCARFCCALAAQTQKLFIQPLARKTCLLWDLHKPFTSEPAADGLVLLPSLPCSLDALHGPRTVAQAASLCSRQHGCEKPGWHAVAVRGEARQKQVQHDTLQ